MNEGYTASSGDRLVREDLCAALNRAVAVAEVEGPDAALTLVDGSTSGATTWSTPSARTILFKGG